MTAVTQARPIVKALTALKWIFLLVLVAATVLLVGSLVVEHLIGSMGANGAGHDQVLGVVISSLIFASMMVTFLMQRHELRLQRTEIAMQRETLARSQEALRCTAEANLRMLHIELQRMSIDDPDLASVWPPLVPGASHEENRRLIYANLVFQNVRLYMSVGSYPPERIEANLRYLFTSPAMREYWRAATFARSFVTDGTMEADLNRLADGICAEYERVKAQAHAEAERRRTARGNWREGDADADPMNPHANIAS